MAQIEINCIGQTAIYTNTPEIFSGDVNIDTVKFTFDEVWDGYTEKTAVFYNNPKDTYPVMLDENNVAVIPEAVIADKCKLSIGVFGTNANGDVKTSKILTYNIGKGAISNDLEATTPADFWAKLLARQINYESNLTEQQTTFESNITEQQTTFESNITQQQNTFESNMENEFNTLQTNVTNEVDTLEGIVKGRNQARVFNTTADMEAWLKDQKNKGVCNVGDNLYIVALDVPDWWISEVLDTPDANTGYYYKIAKLEVQKVDLTNIESDIDNLQSDVNTLESDVNTLKSDVENLVSNSASDNVLWNVKDKIYSKLTDLKIDMPTTDIITVHDILYYNNKIYMLLTKGTTYYYLNLYIYDGGQWSEVSVNSTNTKGYLDGYLQELNGNIYVAQQSNSQYVSLNKYTEGSGLTNIVKPGATSSSYSTNCTLVKDYKNNILYFLYASIVSSNSQPIYYYTYDGTSLSEKKQINVSYSQPKLLGSFINNEKLYISMSGGGASRTIIYDLNNNNILETTRVYLGKLTNTSEINDNIYFCNDLNMLQKIDNGMGEETISTDITGFSEYNGSFLILTYSNKVFKELKLYKTATSYATKGTKIYFSNAFAISDNLQAIDNGYLVTADGEVKIGIYE